MLNRKLTGGLAAAMALSAVTMGAFAAESTSPANDALDTTQIIGEKAVASESANVQGFDLPVDENGQQYFALEDGSKVYISFKDTVENKLPGKENDSIHFTVSNGNQDGLKIPDLKTDENGNQYADLEDGSRVYVSQSQSATLE